MSDQNNRPMVNPTGKQLLMADAKHISAHRELMQNGWLIRSLELAQANYTRLLTERGALDGYSAASSFHKLTGMNEFVDQLKKLAESQEIAKLTSTDKLNHQA